MQGNRRSRRGMLAAIVAAGAAALTATVSAGADTLANDGAVHSRRHRSPRGAVRPGPAGSRGARRTGGQGLPGTRG
jgi:hypothetical protein